MVVPVSGAAEEDCATMGCPAIGTVRGTYNDGDCIARVTYCPECARAVLDVFKPDDPAAVAPSSPGTEDSHTPRADERARRGPHTGSGPCAGVISAATEEDRWADTPFADAAALAREVFLGKEPASWVVYRIAEALAARSSGVTADGDTA